MARKETEEERDVRMRAALENSGANWVNRLKEGNQKQIKNPDGSISTHKMAYGESDGKYYVYPTVQENKYGQLVDLSYNPEAARNTAMANKDYLEFDNEDDAKYMADNGYKKYFDSTRQAYEESKRNQDPWMLE